MGSGFFHLFGTFAIDDKTAAFALPVLERLLASRKEGPRVLIVAPTRELASQICDQIRTLARFTPIKTATIFGGVSAHAQIAELQRRPEILVACPGRLLDLMQQGAAQLNRIETLVLDEADHMFDMGFLPDIRRIIAALPMGKAITFITSDDQALIRAIERKIGAPIPQGIAARRGADYPVQARFAPFAGLMFRTAVDARSSVWN